MRKFIQIVKEHLSEAPISIDYAGNESGSHRTDDIAFATNEKLKNKTQKIWRNSVVDFNVIVYGQDMTPDDAYEQSFVNYKEHVISIPEAQKEFPDLRFSYDAANVIFTNNEAVERLPLTGWMIAHRFFHIWEIAARNNYFMASERKALMKSHGLMMHHLSSYRNADGSQLWGPNATALLGTTNSARNFRFANEDELLPEQFAKYILTGKVELSQIPDRIMLPDHTEYVTDNYEQVISARHDLLNTMKQVYTAIAANIVGKTFIG